MVMAMGVVCVSLLPISRPPRDPGGGEPQGPSPRDFAHRASARRAGRLHRRLGAARRGGPVAQALLSIGAVVDERHLQQRAAGLVCQVAQPRDHLSKGKGRDTKRDTSKVSFHSLRHSATSLLKSAGVSDSVTMDIIGHETAAVSRSYTHIADDAKRAAVNKLPDVTR